MSGAPSHHHDLHHRNRSGRFDPVCIGLGWLLPGLAHLWLGERRRGVLLVTSILGMFLIGVLVGGVDVVDRQEDWLWFVPQALAGPIAFLADYLNVTFVKGGRIGTPSLGRVNEIGTLFCALAGLVNLAAMIDAATRPLPHTPAPGEKIAFDERRRASATTAGGGG